MAFEAHVPQITGVIQLAVAPVFMLTAVGTIMAVLNIHLGRALIACLLLFLREIFLAVFTPRRVPR